MTYPYISFVATARNDDYGGNWVNRINAFIKILAYQAERTRLTCELVFVEYNPIPNKKNLHQELTVISNPYFSVRFIVVPNEFHKTLPRNEEVTVCEFIAKNIGIRRAKGQFILATNPDVLFSDKLFDFFSSKKLGQNTFYRINRKDTSINFVSSDLTPAEILELAQENVIKILYNNQTVYVSYKEWFRMFIHTRNRKSLKQCPLFNSFKKINTNNSTLHENAAGDFLLMHRNLWNTVRGYDEETVGSGIMDGYIMYMLYCKGAQQKILNFPLFHLYHHHGGVRYLASYSKFRKDAEEMLRTKKPYKEYSPNWGHPQENFPSILL